MTKNQSKRQYSLGEGVQMQAYVVYLRNEPNMGRVVKWHGSSMWVQTLIFASLGVFILAAALFVFYVAYRMLALKNESFFNR